MCDSLYSSPFTSTKFVKSDLYFTITKHVSLDHYHVVEANSLYIECTG